MSTDLDKHIMLSCLATEYISGEEHMLDRYVANVKNKEAFVSVVRGIFYSSCDFGNIVRIVGILRMLSRLSIDKLCTEFRSMAVYGLHYPHNEVKDAALGCFDAWDDVSVLVNIRYNSEFLNNYVDMLLNEKNV